MALISYREQLVRMQPGQIMWQPYEADLGRLPAFCVAGRDTWTARVPLVCFCIVETHHPDCVLRQFGLAQERPDHVVYDHRLHRIDLRGKVEKNWREEHGPYILTWDIKQQRLCHAPPQIGEMPRDHAYYRWYRSVTRKYVDRNSAKLDIMVIHLVLLAMLPIGSREHNHVQCVLSNVVGLGGVPAPNEEANNGQENKPTASATPSTSTALLIPLTRGRRATASPSTSVARGRGQPATASPSTSAARGRGRPATASPSTSVATGRGRRATTRGVVTSPEIPAPIPHASPQPEVHPPIPDASPQFEVPPPMVDASPQPEVPSPTPPSQPSFDLGIPLHLTPPMHPKTSSYPPTSSSAPTLPINTPRTEPMTMIPTPGLYTEHHYPPTSSSSAPLGPLVGIDTVHPDTDVPDEHPPHQPSPPRCRPQRARKAPTCGTGGHKIGHKGSSMPHDQPKDDAPQPPPSPKHYTRVKNCKIGCDDSNLHHMTLIPRGMKAVMTAVHPGIILMTRVDCALKIVRLLANHPHFGITLMTADRKAGQSIGLVFPHLVTQDFRLRDISEYEEWYGQAHRAPDLQIRGMQSTIYLEMAPGVTIEDLYQQLKISYEDEEFVVLLERGVVPRTHNVQGSNYCFINVFPDRIPGRAIITSVVGSIAAGGRYDNLIGMFGAKQVPAVGVSLGIERVFAIMEQLQKVKAKVSCILGDDLTQVAELVSELWNAKVKAEYFVNKRVMKGLTVLFYSRIPWMVIVGGWEMNDGIVILKDIEAAKEDKIPRSSLVEELKRRLNP
ncbi:hypothetical protein SO802_021261 [Lithocarpus litseifolius]|uniref:Histidine--tRNA ligase n=1 Tax=Lithocarpus litseifolius TaxID=425828 RepID=A0AAW2CEA7_9ROSI